MALKYLSYSDGIEIFHDYEMNLRIKHSLNVSSLNLSHSLASIPLFKDSTTDV
jgi:hypothetical protein